MVARSDRLGDRCGRPPRARRAAVRGVAAVAAAVLDGHPRGRQGDGGTAGRRAPRRGRFRSGLASGARLRRDAAARPRRRRAGPRARGGRRTHPPDDGRPRRRCRGHHGHRRGHPQSQPRSGGPVRLGRGRTDRSKRLAAVRRRRIQALSTQARSARTSRAGDRIAGSPATPGQSFLPRRSDRAAIDRQTQERVGVRDPHSRHQRAHRSRAQA